MGDEFVSVIGRPKVDEVIDALKTADVFKGGQVGNCAELSEIPKR